METFSKITGFESNTIRIGDGVFFGLDCGLEFKAFFNGSGGSGNTIVIGDRCRMRMLKITVQGIGNMVEFGADTIFTGTIAVVG
jgi:hypothetical protein